MQHRLKALSKVSACALIAAATACTEEPSALTGPQAPGPIPAAAVSAQANWSAWSAAEPLAEINTAAATEGCPYIDRSEHTLYLASNRSGGFGLLDLYVSDWDAAAKEWGQPVNLGAEVNTAANEQCPLILKNGKTLIFVSSRPGGQGGLDLWTTTRRDNSIHSGWSPPVNLTAVNSTGDEFGPGAYEENGRLVLYFNSNGLGGQGGHDLYLSREQKDGTFSTPVPAAGLNTAAQEQFPALARDGLEIFFASDRPGTLGALDLWHATRASTADSWDTPVNLGSAVNSTAVEGRSSIAWDLTTLYFHSTRAGSADLYRATRSREPLR